MNLKTRIGPGAGLEELRLGSPCSVYYHEEQTMAVVEKEFCTGSEGLRFYSKIKTEKALFQFGTLIDSELFIDQSIGEGLKIK